MKAATIAAKNLIKQSDQVKALPKLTAEWEHNRFTPFVDPENPVTVTPIETQNIEWQSIYDLTSIALPNRPRTGIAKARIDSNGKLTAAGKYRDIPQSSRFYLSTQDDQYKYWSSQQKTGTTAGSGGYSFSTPIELTLMYDTPTVANKVVIGFECSYATPSSLSIAVTTDGVNWNTINTFPPIDVDGRITLWRDNNDTWTDAKVVVDPYTIKNLPGVKGVRVTVYGMNQPSTHLDVLQMGARLESDLSDYIETYSKDFELSDVSFISPLGQASSNTASVDLSNIDKIFNGNNSSSPFYGLIGKKVKFIMDLSLDVRPAGSADERVREFTMWTDSWGGEEETTSSIKLKDSSVFLQEMSAPKVFWGASPADAYNGQATPADGEVMTVGAVIWQLMDLVGLSNYQYITDVLDTGQAVQYYWPDGDSTVWEEISSLAEGTQTAVYFDEYDVMQIKTRNTIFSSRETIDWNLDATKNGIKLPDIVEIEVSDEVVANEVEVTYKPTKYSNFQNGLPQMETVWESADDTVILRATPLTRDLLKTDTVMWIKYSEAAYWPYGSYVNIRGEVIKYRGKEYIWRKPGGGFGFDTVYSADDKAKLDAASDPNLAYLNSWSGKVEITERGVGGTGTANHFVRPAQYNLKVSNHFNNGFYPVSAGTGMNYFDGTMTLVSPSYVGGNDYFIAQHETLIESTNSQYGTRMRFPSSQIYANKLAVGGMVIAGDWGDAGYYVRLSPTEYVELEGRVRNELALIAMPGDAPAESLVGVTGDLKGFAAAIKYDEWIDVDVRHVAHANGSSTVTVYLNGVWSGQWEIPLAVRQRSPDTGRWGIFNGNQCRTEYEYVYAINLNNRNSDYTNLSPDETSFIDLARGGFVSGFIEREWRYGYFSSINYAAYREGSSKFVQNWSISDSYVLDEFGPVVHEMREFNATFDDGEIPVSHSWLNFTNEAQIVCTDYYADPFGAKFTLVNTSRRDAVVKGEDTYTVPDDTVDHDFFIYGRVLLQEDELTVTTRDEPSIRKNGVTSVKFDNRFIQSEASAIDIGQWVTRLWAGGVDQIEADIFGNPFIQIGDLVTLSYPVKDMYPETHKYFVVGIKNQYETGLETTLILRRARV